MLFKVYAIISGIEEQRIITHLDQMKNTRSTYLTLPVPECPVLGKVRVASSKHNVAGVHKTEDWQ